MSITSEPLQKFIESLTTDSLALWIGASKKAGSLAWNDGSQWGYVPTDTFVDYVVDGDRGLISLTKQGPGMWFFTKANNTVGLHGCICQYSV